MVIEFVILRWIKYFEQCRGWITAIVLRHLVDFVEQEQRVFHADFGQVLHDFTNDLNFLDATQKLKVQSDGTVVFNFGKYAGQPVKEVLRKEKNYGHWIMEKEFSSQVKQIIKQMMKEL